MVCEFACKIFATLHANYSQIPKRFTRKIFAEGKMSIIILLEIIVAFVLIYAIQQWLREAIQKRRELKSLKKDIELLQSIKSEIEENE